MLTAKRCKFAGERTRSGRMPRITAGMVVMAIACITIALADENEWSSGEPYVASVWLIAINPFEKSLQRQLLDTSLQPKNISKPRRNEKEVLRILKCF